MAFRLVIQKSNQLINVDLNIILSSKEDVVCRYYKLDIERSKLKFFAMVWTVVQPITPKSLLYGETEKSKRKSYGAFLVASEATNGTLSDPVHSKKVLIYIMNWILGKIHSNGNGRRDRIYLRFV